MGFLPHIPTGPAHGRGASVGASAHGIPRSSRGTRGAGGTYERLFGATFLAQQKGGRLPRDSAETVRDSAETVRDSAETVRDSALT
jgi:hypothetical protein